MLSDAFFRLPNAKWTGQSYPFMHAAYENDIAGLHNPIG